MRVGLANSALGDGAQSTFGSTVHYEITPQDIHNIFVEQPNVHRAYKQNVPLKVREPLSFFSGRSILSRWGTDY